MPLLKNGAFIEDRYVTIADEDALPAPAHGVIVSWDRFSKEVDCLIGHPGGLGVVFPVAAEPEELIPYVDALNVIALPFAKFGDGRAYSLARIIRARLKFKGELRAIGEVLPDQIAFMRQVGFDGFETRSDRFPIDTWLRCATAMSVTYQRGFIPDRGFAPADIFEQRRLRQS